MCNLCCLRKKISSDLSILAGCYVLVHLPKYSLYTFICVCGVHVGNEDEFAWKFSEMFISHWMFSLSIDFESADILHIPWLLSLWFFSFNGSSIFDSKLLNFEGTFLRQYRLFIHSNTQLHSNLAPWSEFQISASLILPIQKSEMAKKNLNWIAD